jgi:hypothetical protein
MMRMGMREASCLGPHASIDPGQMAVVTGAGARHAAIRFVSGMLDPMPNHSAFIETAKRVKEPMLVVYGAAYAEKV